jgi:hypothetical protein
MDVKYAPTVCYTGTIPQKFYQYTMLDEASRERFIYESMERLIFIVVKHKRVVVSKKETTTIFYIT